MNHPLLQRCTHCGQDWWDAHVCPKLHPSLAKLGTTPPAEAASAQREAMLDAMCHAEDHTPSKPDGTTYSQREYMALLLDAALAAKST